MSSVHVKPDQNHAGQDSFITFHFFSPKDQEDLHVIEMA